MNKMDQFEEKIKAGKNIRDCKALKAYDGKQNVKEACDFIGQQFLCRIPPNRKHELTVKRTTATDQSIMQDVLKIMTTTNMRNKMRAIEEW